MRRRETIPLALLAATLLAGGGPEARPGSDAACSQRWYREVEEQVPTGDGQGHGPDVGSDEWKSVVEFRLGIRGAPGVPPRDGDAWCRRIEQVLASRRASAEAGAGADGARSEAATGPSFDCGRVAAGSIEATICGDEELSALDRKLSEVYAAASRKATNEHPPVLAAEQRGWIRGRDECWKSDAPRECVRHEYVRRIAELQALYRLVSFRGPVWYTCDDQPANEVVATYFETDPPTLVAERGDSVSLMFLQPSGSGTRYQGRNESLWEHQGEASITWGWNAPEMHCQKAP